MSNILYFVAPAIVHAPVPLRLSGAKPYQVFKFDRESQTLFFMSDYGYWIPGTEVGTNAFVASAPMCQVIVDGLIAQQ